LTTPSSPPLLCPAPLVGATHRLVCFPHAGGSPSFYRGWATHLSGIEVHAVCYPGRAGRINEPPTTDLRQLASELADAVERLADRPLALFGHSLGAPVALETARLLESRGVHLTHLFASGSREAECVALDPVEVSDQDPAELVARLVTLGGTDAELATDPDFVELVLPYVLGDTQMVHSYIMDPEPALRCPVTSIVGDADPDADRRPWSRLTTGGFRERVVPGDHFYLMSDPPFAEIQRTLGVARE
jgi:pyochelin biosynthetic protein PchC